MVRVVLVDDETLVKVGIKSLVDWKSLGFEIVAEGSNGENGLSLIKQHDPQLVITDIVMPKMDGIEMMRLAKEHNPNLQVIVLSSYNEFKLVRKAMKLGAWDYILKLNISSESLQEVLEKVREVILSGDEKKPEVKRVSYDYWSLSAIRQVFLKSIIENVLEDRVNIEDKLPLMDFGLNENMLRLGILETNLYTLREKYSQEQDIKLIDHTLTDLIADIGNEFFTSHIIKWSFGKYVIVFSPEEGEGADTDDAAMKQRMEPMFDTIIEMIKKYVNLEVAVGISGVCKGYKNLPQAFRQAETALEDMFYSGYGSILYYSGHESLSYEDTEAFSFDLKEELPRLVSHGDTSGINNLFARMRSDINDKRISKGRVYELCSQLVLLCGIHLVDIRKKNGKGGEDYNELEHVGSLRTLAEISDWLDELRSRIIRVLSDQNKDEKHVLITRAKKFIFENCVGPVNLKNVADHLNISAGYLSGLFPKYTGMNFTEYVNQVKVEKAQELIRQGSHKIYEISYMLGYDNACYFSKVFKKIAGCTPTEYQQNLSV
ncbi:MAG: response regulator [Clostridiaceae bacterium]|nr:response regulator [Clostridiaceae bacterium]